MLEKELSDVRRLKDFLQTQLVHETAHENIIALGEHYFEQPIEFAAFILCLLESVSPEDIIRSKLLHRFNAAHRTSDNVEGDRCKLMYRILSALAAQKEVGALLAEARCTWCGDVGNRFNSPKSDASGFTSINLLGEVYSHRDKIPKIDFDMSLPKVRLSINNDNILALYKLFGMRIIQFLNMNEPIVVTAFNALVQVDAQAIYTESKGDLFKSAYTVEFLRAMADYLLSHPEKITDLVSIDQRYLLVFAFHAKLAKRIQPEQIERLIQYLQSIDFPPGFFYLLVRICLHLRQNKYTISSCITTLQQCIIDRLMGCDDSVSPEPFWAAQDLPNIETLVQKQLQTFNDQLMTAYREGDGQYVHLENTWRALKTKVDNLLLCQRRPVTTHTYPLNAYELKAFYIKQRWRFGPQPFDLLSCDVITPSKTKTQRILLQALLFIRTEALQMILINYLEKTNVKWTAGWSGDHRCLLEHAIIRHNETLFHIILTKIGQQLSLPQVRMFTNMAACNGNLKATIGFFTRISHDERKGFVPVILKQAALNGHANVVAYILSLPEENKPDKEAVFDAFKWSAILGQLQVLTCFLNLTDSNKPDQDMLLGALTALVNNVRVIEFILNSTTAVPSKKTVAVLLKWAVNRKDLNVITLILGLTSSTKPDKPWVSYLVKYAAVKKDLKVVEHILSVMSDRDILFDALTQAANKSEWDAVTLILGATSDKAAVSGLLRRVAGNGHLTLVKCILDLKNSNKPNTDAVIEALKRAKDNGHENVVHYIQNLDEYKTVITPVADQATSPSQSSPSFIQSWGKLQQAIEPVVVSEPPDGTHSP